MLSLLPRSCTLPCLKMPSIFVHRMGSLQPSQCRQSEACGCYMLCQGQMRGWQRLICACLPSQEFYGILLQHFAAVAGETPLQLAALDGLTAVLAPATAEVPFFAATVARARLARFQQRLSEALKSPTYASACNMMSFCCLLFSCDSTRFWDTHHFWLRCNLKIVLLLRRLSEFTIIEMIHL